MKYLLRLLAAIAFSMSVTAADRNTEHAHKTLEIYTRIIGMETARNLGNVPAMANYLASELQDAGIPGKDVEVVLIGETAALIARYRGDGSSGEAPILLLGHMDVVEAHASDWQRPPFELTSDDTFFFARGTSDNKFGIAQLTSTFIRLKKEGFVPNRDLILVFSGDEESDMATTRILAYERDDLAGAAFALNSDSGYGTLDENGKAIIYGIQAAEKTYATWDITVHNPGGHSSEPRASNAIYELADIIKNIQAHRFPVRWSDMTRDYFRVIGTQRGGEVGAAMIRFAENPQDTQASDRLAKEPTYVGATRTTCIATMLKAGHAENALPQSATITVNCRIFPGVAVADVERTLRTVSDNPKAEFALWQEPTVSPISEMRPDVFAAVSKAVHARYPDVTLVTYMASGGTDGMHFRNAGIPTWAMSGRFMNPSDNFAHGLNERVPIEAFYGALDHWSTILRELAGPAN